MAVLNRVILPASLFALFLASPAYAQDNSVSTVKVAAARPQLAITKSRAKLPVGKIKVTQNTAYETQGAPAPTGKSKDNGWSFEPHGRLMLDGGFIDAPASTGVDDGFAHEVRRARLGAAGDIPGGFGYKVELGFVNKIGEVFDADLSYTTGPVEIIVGQHNSFQSLEELTSSLHTSFIERAAFTDAFDLRRKLGVSATYSKDALLIQGGFFTDNIEDTADDNRGVDIRAVYMPKTGATQWHIGGSFHYNDLGQPDATVRYRQRPLVHFTEKRFLDTRRIAAQSETSLGVETAVVRGRFHAAAEGYWQFVDVASTANDPGFFGGSVEAGVFLTKDSRTYKKGKFDRVKPNAPLGKGGIGSVQFNVRYDHLDLNDAGILGGKQAGYFASLIWKPTAYTLLLVNYGRLHYTDAAIPAADGDSNYDVDVLGVRAQVDF